jgi:hypothetical protein
VHVEYSQWLMARRSIQGIIREFNKVIKNAKQQSAPPNLGCVSSKVGWLDRVDGDVLHGWAYDFETQTSPRLALSVADTLIDEFVGIEFRPDLVSAGIGNGRHGFTWTLPAELDLESLPL